MAGQVLTTIENGIGTLIFEHEARRNAITGEMWDAIPGVVDAFEKSDEVRVVVMRGAGEVAFVSGADISEFEKHRSGASAAEYDRSNQRAFTTLAGMQKPLILWRTTRRLIFRRLCRQMEVSSLRLSGNTLKYEP